MTRPRIPIEWRFWAKVKIRAGCWEWVGGKSAPGRYGIIVIGGDGKRNMQAHRVAYEMLVGEIPEDKEIDHICQNKACVNPLHLRLATRIQNSGNKTIQKNNTSGIKGVHFYKKRGNWTANIRINGHLKFLGYYPTKEEAADAYWMAAKEVFGEFAYQDRRAS